FLQNLDGFLLLSSLKQHHSLVCKDDMRSWIKLLCPIYFLQAFPKTARGRERIGVPQARQGGRWIQLDCATKLPFAIHKIPAAICQGKGQCAMSLRKRIVEFNSLSGSSNSARIRLVFRHRGVFTEEQVGVCQAGVSLG